MAKKKTAKKAITNKAASTARVEKTRTHFRSLIASNPNYFGNLVKSKFKVVKKIISNTNYEQLTELGYNPHLKQLYANFDQKRTGGYGGNLCANGTTEYIRFYVNFGSGWKDVGLVGTQVHNIPAGKDCANKNKHPLSFSAEIDYAPRRRWCTFPQLPRARAILSWNVAPPANQPNWKPVYGNVIQCNIQIDKGFQFPILVDAIKTAVDLPDGLLKSIQPILEQPEAPPPEPGEGPTAETFELAELTPMSVEQLASEYQMPSRALKPKFSVEPSRFAAAQYQAIKSSEDSSPLMFESLATSLSKFDIDIDKVITAIEDTTGNISYEELEDVALDWNQEKLTATYKVKKASGFSGSLCTAGSNEYVSFWADWDDKCKWQYLGTVSVKAYDFNQLPKGGLCYTAALPVDLSKVRRGCQQPKVARVRAVLSWNTPPSKFDPDQLPTWGNRLDAHVLIPPGPSIGSVQPIMTVVGGISVAQIDNTSGLTTGNAKFVDNGLDADDMGRPCPFARRVVVRGPAFPGQRYRVQVRESGTAVWTTLTKKIWVTPIIGFGFYHSIDGDGWFKYLPYSQNFAGVLAYFDTSGNAKWEIRLQIQGVAGEATQVVQLDNTAPTVSVSITDPVGDCGLITPGTLLKGNVVATDAYMGSWSVVIDGGPAGFGPEPVTTGGSGNNNTLASGSEWTYQTPANMAQCGYVVRVHARDRAIVNSVKSNHHRSVDVGFCVLNS